MLTDFITAFSNLDWPAFRQLWVQDPVVFFSSLAVNPTGERVEGSVAFEAAWHRQFDLICDSAAKRGITKPPFQKIDVKDVRVDFLAPTVAVMTFHVGPRGAVLARRMFVIVKTPVGWKISHVTASNLSLAAPSCHDYNPMTSLVETREDSFSLEWLNKLSRPVGQGCQDANRVNAA